MILVKATISSTDYRCSEEGNDPDYDWTYNWKPRIASFNAPQSRLAKPTGGVCGMVFGSTSLSPEFFTEDVVTWPPPVNFAMVIYYTATNDSSLETLITGTAHRREMTRDEITYDIYASEYDADLLEEDTDYDGKDIVLPRAFGAVTHQKAPRLADVSGDPTYHHGYMSGTMGTDWHIYDDGVNIDANATDNADGTFSLSVSAVGEVTVSGTGQDSVLDDIVDWACGASYLNLTGNTTLFTDTIPDISHWADKQIKVIDFLSKICEWCCHLIYISGSTLYLVGMGEDNGTDTVTDYDFFPAAYYDRAPVSILRAEWVNRTAVEETVGKYIKDVPADAYVESSYPYGKEEKATPYTDVQADVQTQLTSMLTLLNAPFCRLPIPMEGSLPVPGKKITITDTMLGDDTTITIHARSIKYDFDNDEAVIEGEGTITA